MKPPVENMPASPEIPDADPRVQLATERTLLAWIRTGLALMAFGFVVARFAVVVESLGVKTNPWLTLSATIIGVLMITMGVVVNAGAPLHYRRYFRRISGAPQASFSAWSLVIFVAFASTLIGIVLAVYLLLFDLVNVSLAG